MRPPFLKLKNLKLALANTIAEKQSLEFSLYIYIYKQDNTSLYCLTDQQSFRQSATVPNL